MWVNKNTRHETLSGLQVLTPGPVTGYCTGRIVYYAKGGNSIGDCASLLPAWVRHVSGRRSLNGKRMEAKNR